METELFRELETVIECGSLTAAAEQLGYTLSGISRSMASLEKELGIQLLYRKKTGVTPTEECRRLMPSVRKLLFAEQCLVQNAESVRGGEQGIIKIGTAYRHYYRWITEVTSQFHKDHPGVQFRIYQGTSTEFAEKLYLHQLDFCLISAREGEHMWYPLKEDLLTALIPAGHPLAAEKEILPEVFAHEPYIATCPGQDIDTSRYLKACRVTPDVQFTTMDIQATYAMVDAGLGISMTNGINRVAGYPGVCHLPLAQKKAVEIGLACGKDRTPAAEAFLKYILKRLPKEV